MYSVFQDLEKMATTPHHFLEINNLDCNRTYFFSVNALDNENNYSSPSVPIEVNACLSPDAWRKIDDTNLLIEYSCNWDYAEPMDCYMNSAHFTSEEGS